MKPVSVYVCNNMPIIDKHHSFFLSQQSWEHGRNEVKLKYIK